MTAVVAMAIASGGTLLGSGVAVAGPTPGILDGDSCTGEGVVRVVPLTQYWEALDIRAQARGPVTLTINQTTTVTNTYKLNAGVDLKVVSVSAGFDVARAEAITVQGSFAAPADPPGAQWVLYPSVRVQAHNVYTCTGGKYVRAGYIAQKLNQIEFNHYEIPPTPYIPG